MNAARRRITLLVIAAIGVLPLIHSGQASAQDCNTNSIADEFDIATSGHLVYLMRSNGTLWRYTFVNGSQSETAFSGTSMSRLALSWETSQFFWTETANGRVMSQNIGQAIPTVIESIPSPNGICIHRNKLYYTHNFGIRRSNLDGTVGEELASELPLPTPSALDVKGDYIYYSDIAANTIVRTELDGSNRTVLVATPGDAVSLSVDHINGHIYWLIGGVQAVYRSDLLGNNITTIVSGGATRTSVVADPGSASIYLAYSAGQLERRNLDGTNPTTLAVAGGGGTLKDIVVRSHGLNDCNTNGMPDECDAQFGDCNTNGEPDECDISTSQATDANDNGLPDVCDDCNTNGLLDVHEGGFVDCNANGLLDDCDVVLELANDCNQNAIPDDCEPADCNTNGMNDFVETAYGLPRLYWAGGGPGRLLRAPAVGGTPETLFIDNLYINDMFIDEAASLIYWTDSVGTKLVRSNLDGTNYTVVADFGISNPAGISVSTEKIYFSVGSSGAVRTCNLDGSNIQTLLTSLQAPRDLILRGEHVYFADASLDIIGRFNLDGTNLVTLVSGLSDPQYLDVDIDTGYIYWVDITDQKVYRCDLDGNNITTIVSSPGDRHGIALDPDAQFIYMTYNAVDSNGYIERRDYDGSNPLVVYEGLGILTSISIGRGGGDCNQNCIPDECDVASVEIGDCNTNGVPDDCDAAAGSDCNFNGMPDECDPLIDLDGDAVVDECDSCPDLFNPDQGAWNSMVVQPGDCGTYNSLSFDADGKLTVAYYALAAANLRLWHDDNGDGISDVAERRNIDSLNVVGEFGSLAFDATGKASASYYSATADEYRYWRDDNGNFAGDAGEIRVIAAAQVQGRQTALTYDASGRANIVFYNSQFTDLVLWHDANGNFELDDGEYNTIDTTPASDLQLSLKFNAAGIAHLAYYHADTADLHLWRDANGNFAVDAGELQVIDSSGAIVGLYPSLDFDPGGRIVIAYYNASFAGLRLFVDADDDATFDPGESSDLLGFGGVDIGKYASLAFDLSGTAVVACYDDSVGDLVIWRDSNQNLAYDDGEMHVVAATGNVGLHNSLAIQPGTGTPYIAYRDETNTSCVLGVAIDWDNDGICFVQDPCPSIASGDGSGDFNGDTQVDGADLALLLSALGTSYGDPLFVGMAESDCDGVITFADFEAWLDIYRDVQGNPTLGPPQPTNVGDLNVDGFVDGDDIGLFVATVLNPSGADFRDLLLSDMVFDEQLDAADVAEFVNRLLVGN